MRTKLLFLLSLAFAHTLPGQNLRLPSLVSDGMVLQQSQELKLWGWAGKGQKVSIGFQGKSYPAVAEKATGKWQATLPPHKAGGPFELKVQAGKEAVTLHDVYVGEVWLASGQSNMEWRLKQPLNNNLKEIESATNPLIRFFDVKNTTAYTPQAMAEGKWVKASPEAAPNFSAIGFFFARELNQKLGTAVGIISSEWGGTPAEAWTSAEALKAFPDLKVPPDPASADVAQRQKMEGEIKKAEADWYSQLNKNDSGIVRKFTSPATPDKSWLMMSLPGVWEGQGMPNFNGIVYYRRHFELTQLPASTDSIQISLGPIDDIDSVFINGRFIGSMSQYDMARKYMVPADALRKGTNVVAVKVIDTGGGGGFDGQPGQMFFKTKNEKIGLDGPWKYRVGTSFNGIPNLPSNSKTQNSPAVLFNAMIAPLIPYTIKGAIWYQGESNASRAYQYRTLFPAMIRDWRARWMQGNFPFLYVQLANYMEADTVPVESSWAELREAQALALAEPNTGMATAIDIGEAENIHPRKKQEIAHRLALLAKKMCYNETGLVAAGPFYKKLTIAGNKALVEFNTENSPLKLQDRYGYVKGFAIAGADKKFHYAQAKIVNGNTVEVYADKVPNPVAVRYGWANNPADQNLYNQAGLPVYPFRTDDWPGITQKR